MRQRAQMPTPPQELPRGTERRRATSRIDSLSFAGAARPSGVNVTTLDGVFTANSHHRTKLSSVFGVYTSMRPAKRSETSPSSPAKTYDETRLAEEIVSALPAGVARELSADRETIRYAVRAKGFKLRTIVFIRESLKRLIDDPLRAIKLEYLQRDLLRNATRRSDFRYPHAHLHPARISAKVQSCLFSAM